MRPIRLLHISDLHERGLRETDRWRVNTVLGSSWNDNLGVIAGDGRPIDFICFTGDIADWGLPDEYAAAQGFITRTAAAVSVPLERVYVVPGNHDIHRNTSKTSWESFRTLAGDELDAVNGWVSGGPPPKRIDENLLAHVILRQQNYNNWIRGTYADLLPEHSAHKNLGYRTQVALDDVPFSIFIIGLDSAFLAGDDHDAQKLIVTDSQAGRLLHDDSGNELPGLRIALYHHPLSMLMERDMGKVQRLLAAKADIALRGHLHDPQATLTSDPDRDHLEIAAGCLYSGSSHPNSINVIDLTCDPDGELKRIDVWVRSWSERSEQWVNDNTVYQNAKDGRFFLEVSRRKRRGRSVSTSNAHPPTAAPPPSPAATSAQSTATTQSGLSATTRAQAYRAQLEANATRAREIVSLRRQAIDKLAAMVADAAIELSLIFEGPLYGSPNGEAQETAALAGLRGFVDLRRISVTAPTALTLDIVFRASTDYLMPFPFADNEELLADGVCNILVADGTWISERVAVITRDQPDYYAIISADANRPLDAEWINSKIDILTGQRLPGLVGVWRCSGRSPIAGLSFGSATGTEALKLVILRDVHQIAVQDSTGQAVTLADVLTIPIAKRRQIVSGVFERCVKTIDEYLDYCVRFDLCEIDPQQESATLDIEIKPVGEPMLRVRYHLPLRQPSSNKGLAIPPSITESKSEQGLTTIGGAAPSGFLTLEAFAKREATRDIIGAGWNLPMIGRESSTVDVLSQFRKGARIVPIIGSGGIGKTRFLVEVAKRALSDGILENAYCASSSLELHRDWQKNVPPSERCLLVLDDPPNAAVVRWIVDEVSAPECRWTAIISLRTVDDATSDVLATASRNKFVAPFLQLDALRPPEATELAGKALSQDHESASEHAISWVARMSQGIPVWLLLASRIILEGADLRDLPRDKWHLAERYISEALPKDQEERSQQLQVLRWLALLHPFNRESDSLRNYISSRTNISPSAVATTINELSRRHVVTLYGVNGRMADVRPAIVRSYLITSWLSRDEGNGAYTASPDGRAFVDHLAANHASIDHSILQRALSALGHVTDIIGDRLPVLDVLNDAVERAATTAANVEEQLQALALASMAAPASLSSFIHAARTLRTTNAPEYVRSHPWGEATRRRAEVLESLPWSIFVACQHARTHSECEQLTNELIALAQDDLSNKPHAIQNRGKTAIELLPRLVSERLSPQFRAVLVAAAHRFVADAQRDSAISQIIAIAIIAPLVTVVVQYNWTEADKFVWGHYVADPSSTVGQDIIRLASEILAGLRRPSSDENTVFLWEQLGHYHKGLMRAMMEGSSQWNDKLLECLRDCREIVTSRQLSGREWFTARKIWHWHASHDQDPVRREVSVACEQLFTRRPELAPFFMLVFDELKPSEHERARSELAQRLLIDEQADIRFFFESALRLVAESGELWRVRKVEALATKLGEVDELAPHVAAFVVSVGQERTPLYQAATAIVSAHIDRIRRSGDMVRLQVVLEKWASVLSPKLFTEEVYLEASVLVQANLSGVDWAFLVDHLDMFDGIPRWRMLGLAFAADRHGTRDLIDREADSVSPDRLHEMAIWFWAGFHSHFIVEEGEKRSALTSDEFAWFLAFLARVPNLELLSGSFLDDVETVGQRHPKRSASWLCALVQQRHERFLQNGVAASDRYWAVSQDRLFISFTAQATTDDCPAFDALIQYASQQEGLVYGLAEFVAELDVDGLVVPHLVVSRLVALARGTGNLDAIVELSGYASSYAIGTPAWRLIAEAACKQVVSHPHDDRIRVYWQLFHQQAGVWSGHMGEVSSRWTSAVTEAEAILEREGDGPLRDLLAWRVDVVHAELKREQGRAQEEAASYGGIT